MSIKILRIHCNCKAIISRIVVLNQEAEKESPRVQGQGNPGNAEKQEDHQ